MGFSISGISSIFGISSIAITSLYPVSPEGLSESYDNTSAYLSWSPVAEATSYKIYIAQNGSFIAGYDGKEVTDAFETVTTLLQNTKYTWYVTGVNSSGEGLPSVNRSFRTKIEKILIRSNKAITARGFYTLYDSNGLTKETKVSTQYDYAEGNQDGWGRISPDGTSLVYSMQTALSAYALFIKSLIDGTELQLSPVGSDTYGYPAWKPDDPSHIYCWKNFGAGGNVLVKINIATQDVSTVFTPGTSCYELDFSSDSSYCIFRYGGTLGRVRTSDWTILSFPTSIFGAVTARYNYNSTKILYTKSVFGVYQLHECNADGSSQAQKSDTSGHKFNPVQQPTAPYSIMYHYDNSGDVETWRCSSSFLGNEVLVDSTGNSEGPTDWALVQYPLEQSHLGVISNKETRYYSHIRCIENGLEERLTSQNSYEETYLKIKPSGDQAVILRFDGSNYLLYLIDLYNNQETLISTATTRYHNHADFHPTLNKIIYSRTESTSTDYKVFEYDVDTGIHTALFRNGTGNIRCIYSSDGLSVFYTQISSNYLYKSSLDGSNEILISNSVSADHAFCFGGKLVYIETVSSISQVIIEDENNTNRLQLTSDAGNKSFPIIASGKIYFKKVVGADNQLWRMNLDGSIQELYSNNANSSDEYFQDFVTINYKLYSGEFKLVSSNYLVRNYMYQLLDNGYLKKVTPNFLYPEANSSHASHAKIDPSGRYIAYACDYQNNSNDQIMLYDRVMNITYNLTCNSSKQFLYPCWSAAVSDTVYFSDDSGNGTISSANITSKQNSVLRTGTGSEVIRNITFGLDGQYVYLNIQDGSNIWTIRKLDVTNIASGTLTYFVSRGSAIQIREMTWKPDGSKLCFSSHNASSLFSLYECDPNGSNVTLRKNAVSSNNAQSPVYSPDSSEIIFRYGSSDFAVKKASTSYDGSGYFDNETTLLDSSGTLIETPMDWKII